MDAIWATLKIVKRWKGKWKVKFLISFKTGLNFERPESKMAQWVRKAGIFIGCGVGSSYLGKAKSKIGIFNEEIIQDKKNKLKKGIVEMYIWEEQEASVDSDSITHLVRQMKEYYTWKYER